MPYPRSDESKSDYISRFMESAEAQADFDDPKQRVAVAYSMYEKRNSPDDHPWPKAYKCSFIEPGVVAYQDLGACEVCGTAYECRGADGEPGSGCKPTGEVVLVKQEALAKMAQSFVGKAVLDMAHDDVSGSTVADGDADGIVTRVWLDQASGWWMCEFLVWSPEAQRHCESGAYSVSCAYEPSDVDSTGGEYHNIPYQQEILDGHYTHLALVTNPRYEGAQIFVNSKSEGGKMSWKALFGGKEKVADLDPVKTLVDVDGKKVALQELFNAVPKAPVISDSTTLEIDGKKFTLAELKNAYRESVKNAAPAVCKYCNGSGKAVKNDNEANPDQTEAHAKEEAAGANPTKPLSLEQESDPNPDAAEAAAKEKVAKEKLNEFPDKEKADAKDNKDKFAEMKKKENESADKEKADAEANKKKFAEQEKKNADEKEAADKKAEEEKRNAGRKRFAELANARGGFTGDAASIMPAQLEDRLAVGRAKYGSRA